MAEMGPWKGAAASSDERARAPIWRQLNARFLYGPILLSLLSVTLLWVALIYDVRRSENAAVEQARRDVSNLTIAFRENITGIVSAIDQLMIAIAADRMRHQGEYRLPAWLGESPLLHGLALQIGLAGPDGIIQFSSLGLSSRVDISDRPHFRHHLDPAATQPYISVPVFGRVSNKWSVQFTRRLTRENGAFNGVIVISVDPFYLSKFFDNIDIGRNGSAILVGSDGIVRANRALKDDQLGQNTSNSLLFENLQRVSRGTYQAESKIDKIERIFGFASLPTYPLIVQMGIATADLLAPVRRKENINFAIGGGLTVLIAVGTALLIRQSERRRRQDMELHAQAHIAEQKAQLDIALNNMSGGLLLFDASERLKVCNRRYIELYGLLPEVVKPGCTFRELLEHRKELGTFNGDIEQYHRDLRNTLAEGKCAELTFRLPGERAVRIINHPLPEGGWVATHHEITEQEQAQRELREARSEAERAHDEAVATHVRLLEAIEVVPEGLALFDLEDRFVLWNKQYTDLYPDSADHIAIGRRFEDVLRIGLGKGQYPDAAGREDEWLAERLARHTQMQSSHEQHLPGDRWVRVEERRTADGGSIGVRIDITELKRREESFRLLFDDNPLPMWVLEPESQKFLSVNDAAVIHYGYSREQFLNMTAFDIRPTEEREKFEQFLRSGKFTQGETVWRHQTSNGTPIFVLVYSRALMYSGCVARLNAIIDVTERKRAEDDLRRTREFLNAVVENVPATIVVKDAKQLRYALINKTGEDYFGIRREEIIGKTASEVFLPATAATIAGHDNEILRSRGQTFFDEHTIVTPRGEERFVTSRRLPILDEEGEPQYLLGVIEDVTENRKAKQALIESEQMARGIVNTALDGFIQMDEGGLVAEWNSQAETIFGWARADVLGQPLAELIVPPAQRRGHKEGLARFLHTGESRFLGKRFEIEALRRDGREIKVELAVTDLSRGGRRVFNAFVRDMTEKLAAEEQLRQAQKMEAVGNLTGGMAHDFNNLLTVIIGNLDLLIDGEDIKGATRNTLDTILQASERGAALTRQMLAFSRRQPLQESLVEVNELIRCTVAMLARTLGENIVLDLKLAPDLWMPQIDHAQLETAIVNIAINARDAMPNGGKLIIETRNIAVGQDSKFQSSAMSFGDYIEIAISDTGVGMPREVLDRVFEPFFTTKPAETGTGLGLSMVYGFMKQSGGHVTADSKIGAGTTFRMCLPRSISRGQKPLHESAIPDSCGTAFPRAMQDKIILAVDDNPAVRATVVAQLTELGYTVFDVEDAGSALKFLDSDKNVDLLLTDIVMPGGLNGKELAKKACEKRSDLKVLFTSGYPKSCNSGESPLEAGDILLSKPYRKRDLAQAVQQILS